MKIDGATTFTQIHQQFQAGGEFAGKAAEKHLRLSGDTLHLHREDKSSGIHFIDRKAKHKEALQTLKESIDRELGPGAGATVFKNLRIKDNVSVGEMGVIEQEFDRLAADLGTAKRALPGQHFELFPVKNQPSLIAGRLSHAADPNQLQGMTGELDRRFVGLEPSKARPEVAQQFMTDFHRMEITLKDGRRSTEVPNAPTDGNAAVDTLKQFAGGDDDVTRGLSKLLTQSVFNAAHTEMTALLRNEQDKAITAGVSGTVDGNAKNQLIEVRKVGGDFVIDFRLASKMSMLSASGTTIDLNASDASRIEMSMQIRVSANDLKAGNLNYQVTRPPQFDMQIVFDPARDVMSSRPRC